MKTTSAISTAALSALMLVGLSSRAQEANTSQEATTQQQAPTPAAAPASDNATATLRFAGKPLAASRARSRACMRLA